MSKGLGQMRSHVDSSTKLDSSSTIKETACFVVGRLMFEDNLFRPEVIRLPTKEGNGRGLRLNPGRNSSRSPWARRLGFCRRGEQGIGTRKASCQIHKIAPK